MLQERPDVTRMLISDLKSSSAVPGLDIYRRNGVEAFTDLVTLQEVEKNAGLGEGRVRLHLQDGAPRGPRHDGAALQARRWRHSRPRNRWSSGTAPPSSPCTGRC